LRHYEIVFLVHPDQSDQTSAILTKISSLVTDAGGLVHRSENIGTRRLAYPIQDQFKASYGLLNIESDQKTIDEIKDSFKYNDTIIRELIMLARKAHKDPSALVTQTKEDNEKQSYEEEKQKKYEDEKLSREKAYKARTASEEVTPKSNVLKTDNKIEEPKEEEPKEEEPKEEKTVKTENTDSSVKEDK